MTWTSANEDNLEEPSRNDATDVPNLAPPQLLLIPRTSYTTNTSKYFRSRISVSTCLNYIELSPLKVISFFYNSDSKIFYNLIFYRLFIAKIFEISRRKDFHARTSRGGRVVSRTRFWHTTTFSNDLVWYESENE